MGKCAQRRRRRGRGKREKEKRFDLGKMTAIILLFSFPPLSLPGEDEKRVQLFRPPLSGRKTERPRDRHGDRETADWDITKPIWGGRMERIGNKPLLQANAVRYDGDCMSQSSAKQKTRTKLQASEEWMEIVPSRSAKIPSVLGSSRGEKKGKGKENLAESAFFSSSPFTPRFHFPFFPFPSTEKPGREKSAKEDFFMDLFLSLSFSIPPTSFLSSTFESIEG